MKHAPYFREQLLHIPWSRLEKDNSFNWDVVKIRLGILGEGLRFGYWSHPYGHRTHDESPTEIEETTGLPAEPTGPRGSPDYMHGQVMLNAAWSLSRIDRQWKLSDHTQIPTLFFADERDAPSRPEPGEVKDWETWYKWRGLPLSSPMALLMDRVLSVHHILVNVLRVADVKQVGGSSPTVITVHYLGGEVELNFIPLFSEIALLLPDTHIDLTIFGKAGYDLVHKARQKLASSPSSRVIASQDIVWSYTAPPKTGGGSIAIRIHSENELWTTQSQLSPGSKYPDAMVALNTGLTSYSTWSDPVLGATIHNIPFAVAEYDEQGLWMQKKRLPPNILQELLVLDRRQHTFSSIKEHGHQFASNPFHRPGQRSISHCRLPFVYNGFVMPVVMKGDLAHKRDK
ncbi:uncharacterized protein STEHIDRAFT_53174 [Stereum hirsutum FP-91666 SS1]|uniref:uncharacterized protein n=1 Tax=Stereum hirsutum (strain FP-91666) TaxID=721885 RepID=UPI000440F221|nr:uncharacterized protein STEHIDRAFT_53174 [Stereum hirsutum FP-91666 SS1]EIM89065.1 hypothetical protein STEHIDRAFT_53174 [Stereum hirsutum FP-91666 SS1]